LACGGFLPFNLRPRSRAAVFMGDSGSQLLGFALAALGLSASWKAAGTTVATLFLPILVLAVPILDTTLVTVVRILEGRPIYQGGRDHTSHRLVYRGLSETRAVLLLGVISAALGGTSLAYNNIDSGAVTLVGVLITFALLVQFATFLSDLERAPAGRMALVALHTRRLVEVLVDFPQSVFVVDWLLCTILVGASRLGERALYRALVVMKGRAGQRRTLIVGAGRGGRSLLRELRETPGEHVVGFVDDDPRLRRRRLQGVAVLGGADEIESILVTARPDIVLVTIPDAPRERLDFVVYGCAQAGVTCHFVRRQTDLDPRAVLSALVE